MSDSIRFVHRIKGRGKWSKKRLRQPEMRQFIEQFVDSRTDGSQDCKLGKSETQDSHPTQWSRPIGAKTTNDRAGYWLTKAEGADILQVAVGSAELQVRAILEKSYKPGVDVDPNIAAFWEYIKNRVPGLVSWGIFSCRNIAGTGTYSSHAWLKGIDIHGNRLAMALCARLAVKYAAKYKIVVVIWNGRIWTPGNGWRTYTGSCPHKAHVHINVAYPSGRPPCA